MTAFDALADSATALGGAGPGLGFAGPMGSFEPFSDVSKLVLTAEMYLGRLEIVPVLVLLAAELLAPLQDDGGEPLGRGLELGLGRGG